MNQKSFSLKLNIKLKPDKQIKMEKVIIKYYINNIFEKILIQHNKMAKIIKYKIYNDNNLMYLNYILNNMFQAL